MPDHIIDFAVDAVPYLFATLICCTGLLLVVGNIQWKNRWKWDE